jgi:glycosyltransferase involved in cell wall biosynthesis
MNILAIPTTYGYSNPISGGQNRFSNLLNELALNENSIHLLEESSLAGPSDSINFNLFLYDDIRIFSRTLSIFRDFSPSYIKQMKNILKKQTIDVVQITHPSGVLTIRLLCKLLGKNIVIVYDAHNFESNFINETFSICSKYSSLEKMFVLNYTRFLENVIVRYGVDYINAVSDDDKNLFIDKLGVRTNKIDVIPSGCHLNIKSSSRSKEEILGNLGIDSGKTIIFFHGAFSHPPNKKAFEIIENYIAPSFEQHSDILFLVGGSKFPVFKRKNIQSIGFIDDLQETLSIADIAIVPLTHGAGTKLKIFDYFSAGLPIVATKKAMEGIEVIGNEHAIVLNDIDEDFIKSIKSLLSNSSERQRIGANGLNLAKNKYEWSIIGKKLNTCLAMYSKK